MVDKTAIALPPPPTPQTFPTQDDLPTQKLPDLPTIPATPPIEEDQA
jgi:hypothetical protein